MKRTISLAAGSFVVVVSLACGLFSTTNNPNDNLVATNQALSMQATLQQGMIGTQNALLQGSGPAPDNSSTPLPAGSPVPATAASGETVPALLASGTGSGDFTIDQYLPVYNLHVVAENGYRPAFDGVTLRNISIKDWTTGDVVIGERWFAITTPLAVGKHTVKAGAGVEWEIWSAGTPSLSFSVHSTGPTLQAGVANYFFQVDRQGVYQIKINVLSGGFVLYAGCGYTGGNQKVKDLVTFNQPVSQSGSYEAVLTPGICFLEVATAANSNNPEWKIAIKDTGK